MGMQQDAVFGDGDKREVEAVKKNNKAIQETGGVYFCSHDKFRSKKVSKLGLNNYSGRLKKV